MIIAESGKSNIKVFPRLYKKTNTGAIQYWDIFVRSKDSVGEIVTSYGQSGTDKPQTTSDFISEGKNTGKKNATTAYEQAVAEAKAKWTKQGKKGYVETKEAALAQEVNEELIAGGIFPMLAQSFSKHASKIKWPCYIQMKYDGTRMIAMVINGKATLWSRTRKPITSLPHVIQELENNFSDQDVILDGEAYSHALKSDFEQIISLVRSEVPQEGHEKIQYHIYDMVSNDIFADRTTKLQSLLAQADFNILVPSRTSMVENETQVTETFTLAIANGFEGVMLRNGDSLYEQNKRSYGLQKVKEFQDSEFQIIGIEEGSGKLAGHVGSFICETEDGTEFQAKMSGSMDMLKNYFENHDLWVGHLLTVKYQGLTGANKVPRFPVGLRIRLEV